VLFDGKLTASLLQKNECQPNEAAEQTPLSSLAAAADVQRVTGQLKVRERLELMVEAAKKAPRRPANTFCWRSIRPRQKPPSPTIIAKRDGRAS